MCMMLVLRPARAAEGQRVVDFYKRHRDPFLLPRPDTDFERAVARGQHFLVEQDRRIVAASGVFDYSEDSRFVELSETLVLTDLRGFGLQVIFFRLRIASVVAMQGPGIGITTAIDSGNTVSADNMRSQGFVPWAPVAPEAYASCPTCQNRPVGLKQRLCCCDFFLLPVEAARRCVRTLLDETADGEILRRGRNGTVRLDVSKCRIVADPDHRAALSDFVNGMTW
ncbi:MAG TPA: hypothetical protein DDZ76_10315 [Xanthomonadales bacterium]|nr:hypothetical protein [Xanthomonadales bacterium]